MTQDQSPFYLGIGMQRSGTTWLFRYLRRHPDAGISPVKEMRFFDSIYSDQFRNFARHPLQNKLARRGLARYAASRPLSGARLSWHFARLRHHNFDAYRAYMTELARGHKIGGEISPSYFPLGDAAVHKMEDLLDRPRYFVSLRNPVDRLLSEASFRKSLPVTDPDDWTDGAAGAIKSRLKRSFNLEIRSGMDRYARIVAPDRLHTLFYEDLFTPDRHQAVCDALTDFLGIARQASTPEKRINTAPKLGVTDDARQELITHFADQFRWAHDRFGAALPANWQADIARL